MPGELRCFLTFGFPLQAYFGEVTYYKQMLESKNKVMQKINKSGGKYINTKPTQDQLVALNREFQVRNQTQNTLLVFNSICCMYKVLSNTVMTVLFFGEIV